MPSVIDLWSYGETGYHSLASAQVRERYKREAMMSAFRILGEGQLSLTKFLLLIDKRADLRDFRSTLQHVLCRTRTETDLYVFSNLSMDTLDYTGPRVNEGSKGVWLGLGDPVRELPSEFGGSPDVPAGLGDVRVFCPGCLVLGGPTFESDPTAGKRFAEHPAFREWPLLVLTDVCLCEYTAHCHCGVVEGGRILNDPTCDLLAEMAVVHARAGADMVSVGALTHSAPVLDLGLDLR